VKTFLNIGCLFAGWQNIYVVDTIILFVFKETHDIRSPAFIRLLSNTLSVTRHLNRHQITILEDTNQTSVRVPCKHHCTKKLILNMNLRGWILRPMFLCWYSHSANILLKSRIMYSEVNLTSAIIITAMKV